VSAASEEAGPRRYRVRAPFVTFRVPRGPNDPAPGAQSAVNPWQIGGACYGDLVPDNAHRDDVERLLHRRLTSGPPRHLGPLIEPVT
jgi:hypothetical protein